MTESVGLNLIQGSGFRVKPKNDWKLSPWTLIQGPGFPGQARNGLKLSALGKFLGFPRGLKKFAGRQKAPRRWVFGKSCSVALERIGIQGGPWENFGWKAPGM